MIPTTDRSNSHGGASYLLLRPDHSQWNMGFPCRLYSTYMQLLAFVGAMISYILKIYAHLPVLGSPCLQHWPELVAIRRSCNHASCEEVQ